MFSDIIRFPCGARREQKASAGAPQQQLLGTQSYMACTQTASGHALFSAAQGELFIIAVAARLVPFLLQVWHMLCQLAWALAGSSIPSCRQGQH
jgi:hypothetical protein